MQTPSTKKPRAKKAKAETTETFVAYKGFDKNLACRGYQYEVGKTFKHDGPVAQCDSGFHVCHNPLDVLDFYPLIADDGSLNRFAKVTVGGKVDRSDDKRKFLPSAASCFGPAGDGARNDGRQTLEPLAQSKLWPSF